MPVARNKSEAQEPSQPKVSLEMLRNAQIVDETAASTSEAPSNIEDSRPSMETLNNAEMVDETPLMDSSISEEPNNKIEPDIKIVDGLPENDVVEKFKKVQGGNGDKKLDEASSLLDAATNRLNELMARNQEILSENSKLKAEIGSLERAHADSLQSLISQKNSGLEHTNQITELKNRVSSLQKDYQALTELHKEAIINTSEKLTIPKPIIEEQPIRLKKSKSWEPPTHNPYKSFSKKYRT